MAPDGWTDGQKDGHVYKWTFDGYFLCSKYPTITPKVPYNHLQNKGHLLFLLFRSTQQVSSGLLGRTDRHGQTYIPPPSAGDKKDLMIYYPKPAAMEFFSKGHINKFQKAVVNEPSVFKPLNVDYTKQYYGNWIYFQMKQSPFLTPFLKEVNS